MHDELTAAPERRTSSTVTRAPDARAASDELRLEIELPRTEAAGRLARRGLRSLCADRIEADLLAEAELLVSELTVNALIHGQGQITLRACLDEARLLVEVIDEGSGFERGRRRTDFKHVGGWGLDIVEDLANRWGVREGATHVWFELERCGRRLAKPDR